MAGDFGSHSLHKEELFCKDFFEQAMKNGAELIQSAIQEQMNLRNTRIRSITIPFSNYAATQCYLYFSQVVFYAKLLMFVDLQATINKSSF